MTKIADRKGLALILAASGPIRSAILDKYKELIWV